MNREEFAGIEVSPDVERQVAAWMASVDPSEKVGSRHHIVPQFYLRRFADKSEQLQVRNRETGVLSTRNIRDLGVKDFYTFLSDAGFDGSIEQILAEMERMAAEFFTRLLNPFEAPKALSVADSLTLGQFLAFQLVRGRRRRREMELMADWGMKTIAGKRLSDEDRSNLRIVPHPNEHIKMLGTLPLAIAEHLFNRPCLLVSFDRPLFVTCDEPVIINTGDDHVHHLPDCHLTQAEIDQRWKEKVKITKNKRRRRQELRKQTLHMYPTRPSGVAVAEEIAMPLTPRCLLMLGPKGSYAEPAVRISGVDADDLAARINEKLIDNAFDWVAAHPAHETFATMHFPPPGALIQVCDGGSPMSEKLKEAPSPRRTARIRKDWR